MKNQVLQYFMHGGPSAFRFELAGDLDNAGARRLSQDWHAASSTIGDRTLIVDMTFVTSVEHEGRSLLAQWHREGAHLVAKSRASRELAESIVGQPVSDVVPAGPCRWLDLAAVSLIFPGDLSYTWAILLAAMLLLVP